MIIYRVYHYEIADEYFADSLKAQERCRELSKEHNFDYFIEEIEVKN